MVDMEFFKKIKEKKSEISSLSTDKKNKILMDASKLLVENIDKIIEENKKDVINARKNGMNESLIDRLMLNEERIKSMSDSLKKIASFPDPINTIKRGFFGKSGIFIEERVSPLGAVMMIYESRPNVTIDAAALLLKTGNISILRGSSAAKYSNKILKDIFEKAGVENGIDKCFINLIEDEDREVLKEYIKQNEYIDVLIPRGGASLKKFINENATIPIIMTGEGVCHIYISDYDLEKSKNIVLNAKTQRPGTCNSVETVLIDKSLNEEYANEIVKSLLDKNVKINVDKKIYDKLDNILKNEVSIGDLSGVEFLDYEIFIKEINSLEDAVKHINKYSTHHSDAILTQSLDKADYFVKNVDSAVTYVNASTRFSDGDEFGFGGEIGISTQKLHARGPMGIDALTTKRFCVYGKGDIRK